MLGALLFGDGSGVRAAGAVRAGRRLEEQRLPLLSLADVRLFDALLGSLDEQRAVAQREIDILDELRRVATSGLTDGTLALASNDTRTPGRPSL